MIRISRSLATCGVLLGCLLGGLLGGLAACGGGGGPEGGGPGRTVLHMSFPTDPPSLDPIQAVDVYRGQMVVYLFDGLVRFEEGEVLPNLASAWKVADDGITYTFSLRDDVVFHNGRRLTADDVRYSFERALRPESQSPLTFVFDFIYGADAMLAGEADALSGLRVIDPRTVEIRLEQPYAPFLELMAMPAAHIVPREEVEAKGEGFSEAPIGTGPWVFESWAHDDVI
ncbi:MAG: ABC transporter substrate-binding protein, partial [Gemmatimonadota bacterium]